MMFHTPRTFTAGAASHRPDRHRGRANRFCRRSDWPAPSDQPDLAREVSIRPGRMAVALAHLLEGPADAKRSTLLVPFCAQLITVFVFSTMDTTIATTDGKREKHDPNSQQTTASHLCLGDFPW